MATLVVHWKKHAHDVYIGRGSRWGNPFTHLPLNQTKAAVQVDTLEEAVQGYKLWILGTIQVRDWIAPPTRMEIEALKGKRLGCYCVKLPETCEQPWVCHGHVLAALADDPSNWS